MTGRLYIDGHDAYAEYGVYVEQGGWNELLSMPSFKTIQYNDWQEEDGIEPDLSAPVLDSKEASLRFAVYDFYGRFQKMLDLLTDGAYHTFRCAYIMRTFNLRLVSVGSYTENQNMVKVTMKFADDFPGQIAIPSDLGDIYAIMEDIIGLTRIIPEQTYVVGLIRDSSTVYRYLGSARGWEVDPTKSVVKGYGGIYDGLLFVWNGERWVDANSNVISRNERYQIDGTPFTDYGIRILKGTLASIKRPPDVKLNLLRNVSVADGATYDPQNVTFKSKDVTLSCLLTSEYLISVWYDYRQLLYDLSQPGERTLFISELEQEFPCYYKSCKVDEFYPDDGKAWLKFTLTLTLTSGFRLNSDDILLASEGGVIVFTEDYLDAIDLDNSTN